ASHADAPASVFEFSSIFRSLTPCLLVSVVNALMPRRDTRTAAAIGRHGRLSLVFEHRRGRTIVAHHYAEPPFRIARTFDLNGAAYAILVRAGPGVFGGDVLTQSIRVGRGARAVLTSQAALQIHPSAG